MLLVSRDTAVVEAGGRFKGGCTLLHWLERKVCFTGWHRCSEPGGGRDGYLEDLKECCDVQKLKPKTGRDMILGSGSGFEARRRVGFCIT